MESIEKDDFVKIISLGAISIPISLIILTVAKIFSSVVLALITAGIWLGIGVITLQAMGIIQIDYVAQINEWIFELMDKLLANIDSQAAENLFSDFLRDNRPTEETGNLSDQSDNEY